MSDRSNLVHSRLFCSVRAGGDDLYQHSEERKCWDLQLCGHQLCGDITTMTMSGDIIRAGNILVEIQAEISYVRLQTIPVH